MTCLSVLE